MSSRSQKPNFFPFNTPQTNVAPNRSQNNNFYQFPLNNQRLKSDFSLDKPVMTIDGIVSDFGINLLFYLSTICVI